MTIDTRPREKTQAELMQHANEMRQQRNRKIRYLMGRRSQAQDSVGEHTDKLAQAVRDLADTEATLATLIESGEKKVYGNTLITLNPNGGVHFEPVDQVGLV